jgi:hypothetical protein
MNGKMRSRRPDLRAGRPGADECPSAFDGGMIHVYRTRPNQPRQCVKKTNFSRHEGVSDAALFMGMMLLPNILLRIRWVQFVLNASIVVTNAQSASRQGD